MSSQLPFDSIEVHRWFSADFFNRVWEYLDMPERSCEDSEKMLSLAHASLAHWQNREDATPENLSIGYWQISRVYAVLGFAELAHHYGILSLTAAENEAPFIRAYAHEAIARAAKVGGDEETQIEHLSKARDLLEEIVGGEERALLEPDLADLDP